MRNTKQKYFSRDDRELDIIKGGMATAQELYRVIKKCQFTPKHFSFALHFISGIGKNRWNIGLGSREDWFDFFK